MTPTEDIKDMDVTKLYIIMNGYFTDLHRRIDSLQDDVDYLRDLADMLFDKVEEASNDGA